MTRQNCCTTYLVVCLEVLGYIELMLSCSRASPTSGFKRVKRPASSVILSGIKIPSKLSVNLNHGIKDHLDVIFFGHACQPNSHVTTDVACQNGSRARTIQVVGWIADTANARNIRSCTATAVDWVLIVFPEALRELKRNLAGGSIVQLLDGVGD